MTVRVAIMPEYAFPLAYGGIEVQSVRSMELLKSAGHSVAWLDPYDPFQEFDLLHVFGNPPSILEPVEYAAARGRVVINAVLGGVGYSVKKRLIGLRSAVSSAVGVRDDIARVRATFALADRIIAITHGEAELLNHFYHADPAKIRVVANSVDDSLWEADPKLFHDRVGDFRFALFVGTITPRKNPLMLLRALDRLGVAGVFIGPGDSREPDYVEAFQKAMQSRPGHHWLGRLDHTDPLLTSAYAAASLFCLPSQHEGQPQVVLEAMAAGTPAIVADRPWGNSYPFDSLPKTRLNESSLAEAIALSLADTSSMTMLHDNFRSSRYSEIISSIYAEAMT